MELLRDKFLNKKIFAVENFFLVFALLFGIAVAFIGTPFQECDGWIHFVRSMDVSYGNVISPISEVNHGRGEAVAPDNIKEYNYHQTAPGSGEGTAYKQYLKSIKVSKTSSIIKFDSGTVSVFYYPQALGLLIGRILRLSLFGCVVLAKIFNLLAFTALAYIAIRITPVLKNTMVAIALLPMTIYQAASFSQDSMLNGLCFLFVALCLYYAYGDKEKLRTRDVLLLGIILSIVFLCKYVYVFIGLLVFIIPAERFGDKKEYFKKFMIALIPLLIIGIFAVYTMHAALSAGQGAANESIAKGVAEMSTKDFLLSNPKNILKLLFFTFCYKLSDFILWLDVLGSLNYPLGPLIYLVPMFLLYVIGSDVSNVSDKIKAKDKLLSIAAFLLVSVAMIIGIYIGDTRVNFAGEFVVQGVQGRYFIAILPALALSIVPSKRTNDNKWFSYLLLGCEFVILCIMIYFLRSNCY